MRPAAVGALVGLVALTAGVAACGSGGPTAASKTVTAKIAADIQHVENDVQTVQIAIGQTVQDASQANIDQLAQVAQQAHDDLSNGKDQVALDSPNNNAGAGLTNAINELKNSMGALVAYTGNPNPATLASFKTQWQTAVGDWNQAVVEIYAGKTGTPPTIGQ